MMLAVIPARLGATRLPRKPLRDLAEVRLGPPVWTRRSNFDFDGERIHQDETFFVGRVDAWDVDTAGFIHLFLNGTVNNAHAGDGSWFYNPAEFRTGPVRAITTDREGNLLIAENDSGYIRKIRFLRHVP